MPAKSLAARHSSVYATAPGPSAGFGRTAPSNDQSSPPGGTTSRPAPRAISMSDW